MHNRCWLLLASLMFSGVVSDATAGDFWSRFRKDTNRNNAWPEPFVSADRIAVGESFAVQTNNGWRLQNTIGDGYFEPDTQELNLAGQLKVRNVLSNSPINRRTVFVLAGPTDEVSMIRVDSVQRAITRYLPKGELPEVLLTDRDVTGGSGEYYDAVDRALKSSVPAPRLKASTGGASSGAASGS